MSSRLVGTISPYRSSVRSDAAATLLLLALFVAAPPARAAAELPPSSPPTLVVQWNQALLQGVRHAKLGPPMVARALAIVHTCMYDAWAAYDDKALGTQLGAQLRRPAGEKSPATVEKAVSYAAYRCAVDLFPADQRAVFDPLMQRLGYAIDDGSPNPATPQGVGNLAASAVLAFRHNDGANQLGTLGSGATATPYADYTNYQPVNLPSSVPVNPATVLDVNHWQPLSYIDAAGVPVTQKYVAPFWSQVKPFALLSGRQFRPLLSALGPARAGTPAFLTQAQEIVALSADLTDQHKMMAEYWADGPNSETPPGHWNLFAQYVSARDRNSFDEDVKLFFALTNAVFDASIVAWDAKRAFDSVRPVTAVAYLFAGQQIRAWGGPGRGTIWMDGRDWTPYQAASFPTPPFPEFISGHSTFSAAAAQILWLFTGKDDFGASVSFPAGSSSYEPGATPQRTVTLHWPTFSAAANEAGLSRRYGGIHFRTGDLAGRAVGRVVAWQAWQKAHSLWSGGPDNQDHR